MTVKEIYEEVDAYIIRVNKRGRDHAPGGAQQRALDILSAMDGSLDVHSLGELSSLLPDGPKDWQEYNLALELCSEDEVKQDQIWREYFAKQIILSTYAMNELLRPITT